MFVEAKSEGESFVTLSHEEVGRRSGKDGSREGSVLARGLLSVSGRSTDRRGVGGRPGRARRVVGYRLADETRKAHGKLGKWNCAQNAEVDEV